MADDAESGAFSLGDSLSHQLRRALQLAEAAFAAKVDARKLTLRQFALLAAAGERAGQSQSELVRATGIDRSTLADMIRRLQDQGLIDRETSALDARAKSVRLSEAGRIALAEALPAARAADEALAGALAKDDRKPFRRALKVLSKAALAVIDPAPPQLAASALKPKKGQKAKKAEKPGKTVAPPEAIPKPKKSRAKAQGAEKSGKLKAEKPLADKKSAAKGKKH